ncbi:MAG: hypothetical protein WAK96_02530, partial [Desulfobaccales bacterium]
MFKIIISRRSVNAGPFFAAAGLQYFCYPFQDGLGHSLFRLDLQLFRQQFLAPPREKIVEKARMVSSPDLVVGHDFLNLVRQVKI